MSNAQAGIVNVLGDTVECPLCAGRGKLGRVEFFEKTGMREPSLIADLSARAAVQSMHTKLWTDFREQLGEQVAARTRELEKQLLELQSKKLALEYDVAQLNETREAEVSRAREAQKNLDQATLLRERDSLQSQISDMKETANKLKTSLEAAEQKGQLAVQAATLDLNTKLTSANLEKQNLAAQLAKAEQALAAFEGAKHERATTTKGGIDFEVAAGDALRARIVKLGDSYEETRNKTGGAIRNSKVGDHVQTLNPDSKGAGLRVVYECKKEAGYTRSDALKELAVARENRQAEVGVLIMAATTARTDPKVSAEFSEPFARHGSDLLIVWDHEDLASGFVLDTAVSVARALAMREVSEAATTVDWAAIDRHLNGIAGQLKHFDEMKNWCGTIHDRTKDVEDRLRIMREQIERDCFKLKEQVDALRP